MGFCIIFSRSRALFIYLAVWWFCCCSAVGTAVFHLLCTKIALWWWCSIGIAFCSVFLYEIESFDCIQFVHSIGWGRGHTSIWARCGIFTFYECLRYLTRNKLNDKHIFFSSASVFLFNVLKNESERARYLFIMFACTCCMFAVFVVVFAGFRVHRFYISCLFTFGDRLKSKKLDVRRYGAVKCYISFPVHADCFSLYLGQLHLDIKYMRTSMHAHTRIHSHVYRESYHVLLFNEN